MEFMGTFVKTLDVCLTAATTVAVADSCDTYMYILITSAYCFLYT